jgi:hypothetical protein
MIQSPPQLTVEYLNITEALQAFDAIHGTNLACNDTGFHQYRLYYVDDASKAHYTFYIERLGCTERETEQMQEYFSQLVCEADSKNV